MLVELENLKKLNESECFVTNSGISEKLSIFLKENSEKAYTVKEIRKEFEKNKQHTSEYTGKIKAGISTALSRMSKTSMLSNIHKKGSYFWYEQIEEGED